MTSLRFWMSRILIVVCTLLASAAYSQTLTASLSFGDQVLGQPAQKAATLKNTQTTALTISSIAITGTNAADFVSGGTCPVSPATLAAGANCSITVTFTPGALGSRSATLTVTDSGATSPQTTALSGTGVTAASLSPVTLSFGTVAQGTTSASKNETLKNNQTVPLNISAIALSNDFYQVSGGTCPPPPSTLAAGASCTLAIAFTPSTTKAETGSLTITDDAANNPQSASLSGTGIAQVTFSPGSLNFGSLAVGDTSAAKTVTFTNHKNSATNFSSIQVTGDFAISGNTCGAAVAPASNCTIGIMFSPSVIGARIGALTFTDDANNSPQSLNISGAGIAPVTVSPASLSFGSLAQGDQSAAKTVTVKNNRNTSVSFTTPQTTGDFAILSNTCAGTISAGATCTTTVAYEPTIVGAETGTLTYVDSAENSPQSIGLTGTGTTPLTISATSLTFPATVVGASATAKSVTVSNKQNIALSFTSITASGDFAISGNTCGTSIAAGTTCTVGVIFSPTSVGSRIGSLTFADSAANSQQTVSLGGTGSAPVTLSTTSLTFSDETIGKTSGAQTVKLTNHLSASVSVGSPAITGDFAIASNTCGTAITSTCTIGLTFTPTASGTRSGTLTVSYGAYGSPAVVSLSGTGESALMSIAVTPVSPTLYVGGTQQFAAEGTYADGSSGDVTSSATWTSSNTSAATITATGLANALATGATTIGASIGSVSGSTSLTVVSSPFTLTGQMNDGRFNQTATLLNNGKVLITGGTDSSAAATASAELYDPVAGTFTSVGSMTAARQSHTATLLSNGEVLITGGQDAQGNFLSSAEIYDPNTGMFAATGAMQQARSIHTATVLPNGKVLVAGGLNATGPSPSAELYDPAAGMFTATGNMTDSRAFHTATALDNGHVLITGGTNGTIDLASAEIYDPVAGTFAATGAMTTPRTRHSATLLNDGTVLLAGGSTQSGPLTSAELYSPTTGVFSSTGSMSVARESAAALLLTNGTVLISGGVNTTADLASAEVYDPTAQMFTLAGSMNFARNFQTATMLLNGQVLIAGGADLNNAPMDTAELYHPATSTPANLVSISVAPASVSIAAGATVQYVATGTFSDNSTQILYSALWSSSNNSVAMVTNDASDRGVALASGAGNTSITATAGSITGSTTLTVTPAPVLVSIAITPVNPSILVNGTQQFTATATYSDSSTANVSGSAVWSSSDNTVATVSAVGLATGVATGSVSITAALNGVNGSTSLTVSSASLVSIAITPTNPSIQQNANQQFTAIGTYSDTTTRGLTSVATWSSSIPAVATISSGGLATGLAAGTTTISAVLGSITASTTLTVTYTPFITTGPLNDPRSQQTATLLNNGKVLITGGTDSSGPTASAELYDPTSGVFTVTGSMMTPRVSHTATLLANGLVLITGGIDNNSNYLSTAELYNPATGTFAPTGSMSDYRAYHTATALTNGQVLIAGGNDGDSYLASAEIYDPGLGTFTVTGSMANVRVSHRAVLLNTGKVLVTGGGNGTNDVSVAELYDPTSGSFTTTGEMITPRAGFTLTLLNGGKVLIAGGVTNSGTLASAEVYDPTSGQFSAVGNMTVPRESGAASLLNNGMVLVSGGVNLLAVQSEDDLFDPATGTFSSAGTMLTGRAAHTSTLLPNGNVLLAGGSDSSNSIGASELFQPPTLTPPGLVSIAVTPANGSVAVGRSVPFVATGTFSDMSTQTLASVNWNSSDPSLATITNDSGTLGLAYGLATGSSSVTASAGSLSGSTTFTITPAPTLLSIALTPANGAVGIGGTQQFTATGTYSDGGHQNITSQVNWSSSLTNVATISNSGLATGVAYGSTSIGATLGSISGSTTLNVTAALTLVSISVSPAYPTIGLPGNQQFSATGTYADSSTQDITASVTWSTSDPTVATINSAGLANAVADGSVTISATAGSIVGSTLLVVTSGYVPPPPPPPPTLMSINVSPSNPTINVGMFQTFTAQGFYSDGSAPDITSSVTWSSSNTSVATIDNTGNANVFGAGTTSISATLDGITGSTTLTALGGLNGGPPTLNSIALSPTDVWISGGGTQQFTATGYFSDGSMSDLTASANWNSTVSTVATVNSGLAVAVGPGSTTIGVNSSGSYTSTVLTVIAPPLVAMTDARENHTATMLGNSSVLVSGGTDVGASAVATAEVFDPAAGVFTAVGSMNTARVNHTATLLNNGLVLIAGGRDQNSLEQSSAELYNPATRAFTPTGSMAQARAYHTATLLKDGTVLIAGGFYSSAPLTSAEIYNPSTGTFTAVGAMATARDMHTATLLNDGTVLIAGGMGNSGVLSSAELYNPSTAQFSESGAMSSARSAHTATLLSSGYVLMVGGSSNSGPALASAELYDPMTESFAPSGQLNSARANQTATLLTNGKVLVAGGYSGFAVLATAELWDPTSEMFSLASPMNTPRLADTATLLSNGELLFAGGSFDGSAPIPSAELYQPPD